MNEDQEFKLILDAISKHLKEEKVFIQNPKRMREVSRAYEIAQQLFAGSTTEIKDDPLQTGSLILSIKGDDMTVIGTTEINLFCEMVSKADNFEIYPTENRTLAFAAVFQGALKKL